MWTLRTLAVLTFTGLLVTTPLFPQEAGDETPEGPLAALGTAFTYQGQLLDGGSPANGSYDLQLKLFNALAGGSQLGSTVTKDNVAAADGLFTVDLDFGASPFTGQALWLEIGVRPGASSGAYTTLSPRQPLNPAPFAHYAKAGIATDVQCSGCVDVADLAGGTASTGHVLTATGGSTMAWQSPTGLTGSGSAGQVAFWSSASMLSGSSNFYWNNANGRLGLGTTSPSEQLELTGNLRLPVTTSTAGTLLLGNYPFMHAFGQSNTFLGIASGNFGITGPFNTGLGTLVLTNLSSGDGNTGAGSWALVANTVGSSNSAFGSAALQANTSGNSNTALGYNSLSFNTTANRNTAVGVGALYTQDFSNGGAPWDSENTAVGYEALNKNKPTMVGDGIRNSAVGAYALHGNTTGHANVAVGVGALLVNTSASNNTALGTRALATQSFANGNTPYDTDNTAVGFEALYSNQPTATNSDSGNRNTAVGSRALYANTDGSRNTAVGNDSLSENTYGHFNTAVGGTALQMNTAGDANAALGFGALSSNTTGLGNTAVGVNALALQASVDSNIWTSDNTAVGLGALFFNQPTTSTNAIQNTALGTRALFFNTTGSYNVALGWQAMQDNSTGSGNIAIGHLSAAGFDGDNQLFIGNGLGTLIWGDFNTKFVGIGMTGATYQLQLATDSAGKPNGGSWANSSDARLKRDIAPLSGALEKILSLQGVSFDWVNPGEHGGRAESAGFIAQDVERVFPEWVSYIDPAGADRALVAQGEKVRSLTLPFAFDAYLVEAIREQQEEIDAQRQALAEKDRRMARLADTVESMQSLLATQQGIIDELRGRVEALEGNRHPPTH